MNTVEVLARPALLQQNTLPPGATSQLQLQQVLAR